MIRKGILKSFNPGTYKASVQIIGSLSVWLDNVVVSEALAAADMVAGRSVAVLFLDPGNPDDAVVIGLWGAVAAGGAAGDEIKDADNDTKIQVEESADEDKIRMDVAGVEAFHLSDIGILTLAKQAAARAKPTLLDQKMTQAAYCKVMLDSEDRDVQNEFDSSYKTGTATAGTTGTTLKDTTLNPFVPGDVGRNVYNHTDAGVTTISAYVSASEVTLTADIDLDSGDTYYVFTSRYTVTEDGTYLLIGVSECEAVLDQNKVYVRFYKNGSTTIGTMMSMVSYAVHPTGAPVMVMTMDGFVANDYIELAATTTQAGRQLHKESVLFIVVKLL